MDTWVVELERGRRDAAWDSFLDRYRRLIFATIRHYAHDYDDVMDVFTRICEGLRADDLRRLRSWVEQPNHRARFSTWLVTVVRNLTVDWFRQRDGRRRLSAVAEELPELQRRIFAHVFLDHRSHVEAYELIRARDAPDLSFKQFLAALRAAYRAVTDGRRGYLLRDLGSIPLEEASLPDVAPDLPTAPSAVDAAEQSRIVERALASLEPDDRVAVELYVLEDVPADAVARILGLPNAKAVYNRVYRAFALLRAHVERAGVQREDI